MRYSLFFFLVFLGLLPACEKEFIPDLADNPASIVVEGYIEAGDRPSPPYVILTRSLAFFSELSAQQLSDIFVHDAKVTVSDGAQTVELTELCFNDLTPEQRLLAGSLLGLDVDSIGFNFCAYTDLSFSMRGEVGRTYTLEVETPGGASLRAQTTTPPNVRLDSLWFVAPPGQPTDSLAQLRCRITDPDTLASFYRYATRINQEPFRFPFASVLDDRLFDGQSFEFPLSKAESRTDDLDPATFGLYRRGDTLTLKWINLDEAHYNFWNTLEFNTANQGPFSSYTRIESNIEGGLGIWGGLSASYYTLMVPLE